MAYEWDSRRARRGYLIKMLSALVAGGIIAAVPAWFVVEAINH